jgi:hypothetical protein
MATYNPFSKENIGYTAGAGLAGGAIAKGLFGKSKLPSINIEEQKRALLSGGEEQRRLAGQIRPETQKLTDEFGQSVDTAQEEASARSRQSAQDFLSNYDPLTSKILQERQNQLKQNIFAQNPETIAAAREAGAAGGGLQRGVVQQQLANIPVQAAAEYAKGATELNVSTLEGQLAAREKVFDTENQMNLQNLGIDAATAETILNSGNQALINELNALIDESKSRTQGLIDLENFKQSGQLAKASGEAANQTALLQSGLNLAGTIFGGMYGGPAGAAVGSQAGNLITQVPNNRRRVIQNSLYDSTSRNA